MMRRLLTQVVCAGLVFSGALLAASAALATAPDFDQVMQSPDDPQLNLDYATSQANSGHLLEAAAALERVLAVHPEWSGVRLLYAVVLYRLDDLQGAQAQIAQIDMASLSPLQRAEAAKYQSRIHRGRDALSFRGDLSIGADYETNATGALAMQVDFGLGVPKQAGASSSVAGDLEADYKLSPIGPYSAFASVSGVDAERLSGPEQQYHRVEAQIGLASIGRQGYWKVAAVYRDLGLFRIHYLTETGARVEAGYRIDSSDNVSGALEAAYQDYNVPLDDFYTGLDGSHNGWRFDLAAGVRHRFDAHQSLSGSVGVEDKEGRFEPFAYIAERVGADYHASTSRGVYVDASGGVRWVQYKQSEGFFFDATRRDIQSSERLAVGAPLSAFTKAGATGDVRENVIIEAAVHHATRDTLQPLANYDSTGFEVRLLWRFGAAK
jgi:hypothetical protein